ncbi:channel-forming protein ArfA/OmpATb [Mycobacterium botniense]|uniref:Peptidoglycan-binding protein ArfA n=1 Tax=Mycobacterium botniense TaxID=84962 RepID=A0A7I9XYE9_9MYCO|nr:OmpA family protein [Mycobacterium botniense]GFG74790.1 peptidoglycan-binding protein ArfA [Mycobacterium botniense]
MAHSGESPAATGWRRTAKFYRRSPGLPWLIAVVVIPLLLAAIGYGAFDRSRLPASGPTGVVPTLTESPPPAAAPPVVVVPGLNLAPLSISRRGDDVILTGDLPDDSARSTLLNAVITGIGPGVNIIDMLGINPDVDALDFADAESVFTSAASIPDFNLTVRGDTITLAGTADSANQEDAVETAAEDAWPDLNIVDKMEIKGPVSPTGTPGPTAAPQAPGPNGSGATCADLQSQINRAMGGPITFASDGYLLTPADEQRLTRVADTLKECPGMKVTVKGYTDNTGDDAVNIPLSADRADAVADFLIAKGVTRERLIAKGLGSADPVASNDTADGRAKNRRVEIVVS